MSLSENPVKKTRHVEDEFFTGPAQGVRARFPEKLGGPDLIGYSASGKKRQAKYEVGIEYVVGKHHGPAVSRGADQELIVEKTGVSRLGAKDRPPCGRGLVCAGPGGGFVPTRSLETRVVRESDPDRILQSQSVGWEPGTGTAYGACGFRSVDRSGFGTERLGGLGDDAAREKSADEKTEEAG